MRIEAALAAIWDKLLAGDVAAVHAFCRLEEQARSCTASTSSSPTTPARSPTRCSRDPDALKQRAFELRDELAEARRTSPEENGGRRSGRQTRARNADDGMTSTDDQLWEPTLDDIEWIARERPGLLAEFVEYLGKAKLE
jgi:hypothetical protein